MYLDDEIQQRREWEELAERPFVATPATDKPSKNACKCCGMETIDGNCLNRWCGACKAR